MTDIQTCIKLALAFPDAEEHPHFELSSFRINNKIFATLDIKRNRLCVMLNEIDQSVFVTIDKTKIYAVPNKWGQKGATYFELSEANSSILKDALNRAYLKAKSKH